ncbi:hypothetical protein SSX86_013494 [Deinandra increscens subsp. villosa]|uniref:Hydroxyproline-rich glycoprotein family protein n=1 Tax=Deinandra increscens subsp. villosa TaxID=3103831 RepID=A0AAP0D7M9_9ASTR
MEEDGTPTSPFWIQTTANNRRSLSSLFFNSFVLITFLLLFAVISMVFIIPSLIHLSSNIFRPNLVKRSWDSINLILVLIALLFGFLSRNISSSSSNDDEKLNFETPEAAPPIMYDQSMNPAIGLRRQRTSVSYPDLRELSPPYDPWRFSDDTHLNYYRVLDSDHRNNSYFPIPPPQPPANAVKRKTKRVYRNVAVDDGEKSSGSGSGKIFSPETESSEQKGGKRNDGDATKGFFTSFHHNKKKKKRQRDRSVDNLGALLLHHSQPPATVKLQPPAPPPPTPPPLVLHNSCPSKNEKGKKFISITLPPPPPPPPPPQRAVITRLAPFVTDKPGPHLMAIGFNGIDDSSSGGESPMKRIPPPPPLPPFKMPDWKFAVEGDFVRLQSTLSSRSASPDGDEAQSPSSDVDTAAAATALFCPSPDVDTKADSFIAKFRAGLKLERMSKLGPGPSDN